MELEPVDLDDKTVKHYLPLIKMVAGKIVASLPAGVDVEDLVQAGSMGLMDAFKKYDPTLRCKFKSYAEHRIRGAMLDYLREQDVIKRLDRNQQKALLRAKAGFQTDHGREPSKDELVGATGFSIERIDELLNLSEPFIMVDEEITHGERVQLLASRARSEIDMVEKIAAMQKLERVVAGFKATYRGTFILYYIWGLNLKEIGDVFGITESRVSQILSQVQAGRRPKRTFSEV